MKRSTRNRWFAATKPCCYCIPNHRRMVRKHASDAATREPSVVEPHIEGLDRVRDHARIEWAQLAHFSVRQMPNSRHQHSFRRVMALLKMEVIQFRSVLFFVPTSFRENERRVARKPRHDVRSQSGSA